MENQKEEKYCNIKEKINYFCWDKLKMENDENYY